MNHVDEPDGRFFVLVNDEEQRALWRPVQMAVPFADMLTAALRARR
jgi:uncharacterized protein YbdZ (MbtH family)